MNPEVAQVDNPIPSTSPAPIERARRRKPPAAVKPQYLTAAQAAALTGRPVPTVYDWLRRGLVGRVKLPGKNGAVLIPLDDLERMLREHYTPPRATEA